MTLSDTNNSRSLDDTQECDGSPKKGVSENFEQDVVDYCSSSEKYSEGRLGHPTSSNSANSKKDQSLTGPENETPIGGDPSDESDFLIQEHSMNADNPGKFEGCMHGAGSSQVNESLQIPVSMANRNLLDFDLNEVYSEDTDLISITDSVAPISSAMLPAQGKGMSPPCFEGERAWKGPAAASAFRTASGFKASEGEKTPSSEESNQRMRYKRFFGIDLILEVRDDAVDVVVNTTHRTRVPGSTVAGMVDGRGSSMVPQVMFTSSDVISSYPQHDLRNVTRPLSGPGTAPPCIDLNSSDPWEDENIEAEGGSDAFGIPAEEHMRDPSQPKILKRKEAEISWEEATTATTAVDFFLRDVRVDGGEQGTLCFCDDVEFSTLGWWYMILIKF